MLNAPHLCHCGCGLPDLEPVTPSENVWRGAAPKLTWAEVRAIRASQDFAPVAALRFGVSRGTIYDIRAGRTWVEEAA